MGVADKPGKRETMAEMAATLLSLEGENIEVVPNTAAGRAEIISDENLDLMLDRRPEVFENRGMGWTSAAETTVGTARKTTAGEQGIFAVYQAPPDEGNDALAKMLGEDVE